MYRDADGKEWVRLYDPWGEKHPSWTAYEFVQAHDIHTRP